MTNSTTSIFIQDACYQHRFIRSNDLSSIVERPERLRAVKIGLSAAIARLEELSACKSARILKQEPQASTGDELADALQKLDIVKDTPRAEVVTIVNTNASADLLRNEAVKYVHGDIEGDIYLENLVKWAKESSDKIIGGESEIPSNFAQGDLYLCPESLNAIQGALGAVCEAVDSVINSSREPAHPLDPAIVSSTKASNAFVAIRPPGHHCGENTPCGFCFVNNVVVAAAHAHLKHNVKKIIIFDIDLHHGNGTQSLVWQINEETYRQTLESEASENPNPPRPGPQIFYGSLHDILSYPCEDGNLSMVQAASVSIHGPHGQFIENVHLHPYETEEDFWRNLYPEYRARLFEKAEAFLGETAEEDVLLFISCGFDACEHEYSSMSRHGRRVPSSFYHRFAADAREFSVKHAKGKLVSVLEGGYSDRALMSGAFAHLCGLVDSAPLATHIDEAWWNVDNLSALEKATKKRRGGRLSHTGPSEPWIERTMSIFQSIETVLSTSASKAMPILPPSSMTLRERKPASNAATPKASPQVRRSKDKGGSSLKTEEPSLSNSESVDTVVDSLQSLDLGKKGDIPDSGLETSVSAELRKLPRVILRVRDPENV